LGALAEVDHFGDVNKMIRYFLTRVATCGLGLFYHAYEVSPFRIPKQLLQSPRFPVFNLLIPLSRRVKVACERSNHFSLHGVSCFWPLLTGRDFLTATQMVVAWNCFFKDTLAIGH
jgi:hypothetical protein